MLQTFKIATSQIGVLKTFANKRKTEINDQIAELINERKGLEEILEGMEARREKRSYTRRSKPNVAIPKHYSQSLTWPERISYVLGQTNAMMRGSEISAEIIKLNPFYADKKSTVDSSISAQLSSQSKRLKDRFVKTPDLNGIYLYGNNPRFNA